MDRYDFSEALRLLKAGRRVARDGWNGKGMWIVLIRAAGALYVGVPSVGGLPMQDCIGMRTATGQMQPGWLASQADMLAEDWVVVS